MRTITESELKALRDELTEKERQAHEPQTINPEGGVTIHPPKERPRGVKGRSDLYTAAPEECK